MVTAIFDGNYLLHRCMRAGDLANLHNRKGKPTGGVMGFLKSMQKTLREYSVRRCIVVFDAGISPRRRALYPGYKGAKYRAPDDPHFEENLDPEKALYFEEFEQQRRYLQHMLRHLVVRIVKIKGWEADDLCYRIARHYNKETGTVLLVSDDQDYLQAVREWKLRGSPVNHPEVVREDHGSLRVYRPIADELVTELNFVAHLGHYLSQHLLHRAIVGDSSDKIEGVFGVGKGWMRKVFADYKGSTAYPFEDFFLYCMEHRTKTVQKIAEQMHVVLRNYELMCLDEEPYPTEVEQQVLATLAEPRELNMSGALRFMHELDLHSITSQFPTWVTPFQRLH